MSAFDSSTATMPAENTAMPAEHTSTPAPRLTLQSQLEELVRLWPWVQALAGEYAIPADTQFAIDLCLEEALSNIIRHGYRAQPGFPITIDCAPDGTELVFTVEDQAPAFDPLAFSAISEMPPPSPIDRLRPGGHGIRLMRRFAGSLDYRRLANGNRLTVRVAIPR